MADKITLKPIKTETLLVTIEGTSPLIQHQWSEKAREMMRAKKAGKKTKTREACNPQEEAESATYRTADGGFGVPVTAIKGALVSAAHKDIGVEKTLIRKSLFIKCDDANNVLPMTCSEPRIREDHVKVGMSQADLRYRPEFTEWEVPLLIEYNTDNLTPGDIINLLNLAGFGVGICEWRPEKGGDCGRFQVREG